MAKRKHIPELAERRLRERLEDRIEKLCKEGVITNGRIDTVDCTDPRISVAEGGVSPARGVKTEEIVKGFLRRDD
jgi:hypothetical protein